MIDIEMVSDGGMRVKSTNQKGMIKRSDLLKRASKDQSIGYILISSARSTHNDMLN